MNINCGGIENMFAIRRNFTLPILCVLISYFVTNVRSLFISYLHRNIWGLRTPLEYSAVQLYLSMN